MNISFCAACRTNQLFAHQGVKEVDHQDLAEQNAEIKSIERDMTQINDVREAE